MARARGSNAKVNIAFEATEGTVPAAGAAWHNVRIVSHTLGEEVPDIDTELLGNGREPDDPVEDVKTDTGDVVVPIDPRAFGLWLKLFFGAPATSGDAQDGYSHVFTSGAASLPSASIEIGAPDLAVPNWNVNRGAKGNTLKWSMSRGGLLNATCSLICIGETPDANTPAAGANPAAFPIQRFAQASGSISKDGVTLGEVISSDFTFSNQLETVDSVQADGRIGGSDPGMVMTTGTLKVKFKDRSLFTAATQRPRVPMALEFGWSSGPFSLYFNLPRVFLPKPKTPIDGPNGIMAIFNWRASGAAAASCTATLTNDIPSYA